MWSEQSLKNEQLCLFSSTFNMFSHLICRFFHREPGKDLLSLHKLRHLVQLELLVERSFILRDYLNGHPWPSPCVQELINELRDLSENRITVITTMRQRNLLRECDCLWEGDWSIYYIGQDKKHAVHKVQYSRTESKKSSEMKAAVVASFSKMKRLDSVCTHFLINWHSYQWLRIHSNHLAD